MNHEQEIERACNPVKGDRFIRGDVIGIVVDVFGSAPDDQNVTFRVTGDYANVYVIPLLKFRTRTRNTILNGCRFVPAKETK